MKRFPSIHPNCRHFLHGGDYNPDQWLDQPEIINEDFRLMKLAHCNAMSIGIFAWTALEPAEGRYTFDWLDRIMDRLAAQKAFAVLATPSGARPAWLSQKYPEVLRVASNRVRNLHGIRHNHCFTSPVYREKVAAINHQLAERYRQHPALLVWHISNEYGGDCHCPLCQAAFRAWLQKRYGTLDALNRAWYAAFWSHTFTDWAQIESPAPHGEPLIHGLNLDWQRFVTDQTVDFMRHEIAPLKKLTPDVPVTTNFMGTYTGLDYWKLKEVVDVISWDSYPRWHRPEGDIDEPAFQGFIHDMCRAFKDGKPFMLMESTPSMTNWQPVAKLKRPGLHVTSSLLAVAHGSDTVQYFQWRKSRGSCEKFHGAVVCHAGHENTRVFRDVADLGRILEQLDPVIGTSVQPEVALIYDWENRWAIDDAKGVRNPEKGYLDACFHAYRPFWESGVPVDVINMDCDFSRYRLVVAPMLYMLRPGVADRLAKFVKQGGTLVATYFSGIVNETDLCFLGGFPGPLRPVLGIWAEETDALYDSATNPIVPIAKNALGLTGRYAAREWCELIHAETAQVLAKYGAEFYRGQPALTVNQFGRGQAYYLASRNDARFHRDFTAGLVKQLGLRRVLATKLPDGVTAQLRTDGQREFVFLLNFQAQARTINLGRAAGKDLLTGGAVGRSLKLPGYGWAILERQAAMV